VAGLGIDLDVVGHPVGRRRPLQPPGGPMAHRGAVLAAVAGHDRTRPGQQPFGIGGAAAIVGAGGGKAAVRGQGQGVAAAHAEPDHPDPAGALVLAGQPGPGGLDVVEGPSLPAAEFTDDGPQAGPGSSRRSRGGRPRPATAPGWRGGHIGRQLPTRGWIVTSAMASSCIPSDRGCRTVPAGPSSPVPARVDVHRAEWTWTEGTSCPAGRRQGRPPWGTERR
jgi:hypothetical protein